MTASTVSTSSGGRWLKGDEAPMSYVTVAIRRADAMTEANATPPSLPEGSASVEAPQAVPTLPQEGSSTAREAPTPRPRLKQIVQPARPVIRIQGEPFYVERDEGRYYIVHDRWSLMGSGLSLAAAYKDLLQMAAVLAPVYGRTPPIELDEEGTRLTRFLLHSR